MKENEKKKKLGLLLPGGGTKGAFQAGALKYLINDFGRKYDVVAGFSIGALNGSAVAQGDFNRALELWENTKSPGDFIGGNWSFYKGLLSMKPLRKRIEAQLDVDKLRASKTKFLFTVVDLQKGVLVEKDKFAEPFIDWLLASCSIPGVFEPIEIDGHQFVDGGVLSMEPLAHAIREGVDEIDIIPCRSLKQPESEKRIATIIEVAQRCLDLIQSDMLRVDVDRCRGLNKVINKWGDFKGSVNIVEGFILNLAERREDFPLKEYRHVKLNIIQPDRDYIDVLDFDQEKIRAAMDAGYEQAVKVFSDKNSDLK